MGVGISPPADGGPVHGGSDGLAVLAGVHHDHQVPRQVPAGRAARGRLRHVPSLGQQVHLEEGTHTHTLHMYCTIQVSATLPSLDSILVSTDQLLLTVSTL